MPRGCLHSSFFSKMSDNIASSPSAFETQSAQPRRRGTAADRVLGLDERGSTVPRRRPWTEMDPDTPRSRFGFSPIVSVIQPRR